MSQSRHASWQKRYTKMGDEAEAVFEQVWHETHARAGFSRPPFSIQTLPVVERYRPDYITPSGYVECMGFGREQTLRLKMEKLQALHFWNLLHPVHLFVWDSHKKRWAHAPLADVQRAVDKATAHLGYFTEGKAYFGVPADTFKNWQPHKVVAAA